MLSAALPASAATLNVGVGNGNTLQSNRGVVVTNVQGSSNTGRNVNAGGFALQGSTTGAATTGVVVANQVNANQSSCGCTGLNVNLGALNGNTAQSNSGFVATNVSGSSNTGGNANFALLGAQLSGTGNASTGVVVQNIVNTNVN